MAAKQFDECGTTRFGYELFGMAFRSEKMIQVLAGTYRHGWVGVVTLMVWVEKGCR